MSNPPSNPALLASPSILIADYVRDIAETDKLPAELAPALIGLFGEVGSLMTTAKKHTRDKDAYAGYLRAVYEEFGDALWYFAAVCRRLSVNVEDVFSSAGKGYGLVLAASDLGEGPLAHVATPPSQPSLEEAFLRLGECAASLLGVRTDGQGQGERLKAFADCYLQAVQASGVSFAGVVRGNLKKARGRFVAPDSSSLPTFDSAFSEDERIPSKFEIVITRRKSGQSYMQWNGVFIGDPLTDNIRDADGYRFHDVFHLAHGAILHWSPVFRALIKHKRKSDKRVDEAQDGGRAIVVEEGLTAWIFAQAKELNFFEGRTKLSFDLLKTVEQFVRGYEVEDCPLSLWERAILDGYEVFRQVRDNNAGIIIGDRVARTIRFKPLP